MFDHRTGSIAPTSPEHSGFAYDCRLRVDQAVPTTHAHLAVGGLVIAGIVSLAVLCTPVASTPMPVVPGFFTAFATAMILLNVRAGFIMLNRGAFEARGSATALGGAYLTVGGIFVPFTASFPDAIVPGRLLGGPGTAVLFWACWHCAFALSIARYAWIARSGARGPSLSRICVEVLVMVGASSAIALGFPAAGAVSSSAPAAAYFLGESHLVPELTLTMSLGALALCARLRARTIEELYVTLSVAAACLDIWLTMAAGSRFSLGWYVAKGASLLSTLCATGFLMNETLRLYRSNAQGRELLRQLVCIDGLTGIANRRRLDDALEVEWRRARRDRTPLSVLLIDVDWFKAFNDGYGHPAGDGCLKQVAGCIAGAVHRPADLAARYGGEEFAVVLPNTDVAGSVIIAERIRSAVEELRLPHKGSGFGRVTVSVGAATLVPDRDGGPESLMANADAALYDAKRTGRNRVGAADPPPEAPNLSSMAFDVVGCSFDA